MFSYGRTASCAVCGIKTRHSAKPLPVPSTGTANIATKTGPINPAVHLSPVLPARTQKVQGPVFTDGSLPTSVHLCLSKPGQAANLQEEDERAQHKALEKLSNERSLWEINCRMAAEGPGRSGDDDLQPSRSSWRSGWGAGTERAGWPGACQLFTFNKLARIRKLRLGS